MRATSLLVAALSVVAAAPHLVAGAACNHDNCLRALLGKASEAQPFCQALASPSAPPPPPPPFPTFVTTACTGTAMAARVTSACACLVAPSAAAAAKNPCSHDNCLRAFIGRSAANAGFCSSLVAAPPVPTVTTPAFAVKACTGNVASRVASACSCFLGQTPAAVPVYSNTSTPAATPTPSPAPAASCTPSVALDGASTSAFNAAGKPFALKVECGALDVDNYTVFANYQPAEGVTATPAGVSLPGFSDDSVVVSLFAKTVGAAGGAPGIPIVQAFQLVFGTIDMPVLVLGPDGAPVQGAVVTANATTHPGVSAVCTTDATGKCSVANLPPTTIGLVARTPADNAIAVDGIAATKGLVTLHLMAYVPPSAGASFDVANGTTGWSGGTSKNLRRRRGAEEMARESWARPKLARRDPALVVDTKGLPDLQSASNSFPVDALATNAFIKYKFVTSEVPGGFFGIFNDFYSVTIRADTGAFVTVTNSMNALGLGAFDFASGSTDWFTLTLAVPSGTKSVRYDVGVANVGDDAYQSQVVVALVDEDECAKCGDCAACPSIPACQPKCKAPPAMSCDFYRSCADAQLGCGPGGYALAVGEPNCLKIGAVASHFTPAGRDWLWSTMQCLQTGLVPALGDCATTCDAFAATALAGHATCYLAGGGVCKLGCADLTYLFMSVGTDLVTLDSLKQAWAIATDCMKGIAGVLASCPAEGSALVVAINKAAKITADYVAAGAK